MLLAGWGDWPSGREGRTVAEAVPLVHGQSMSSLSGVVTDPTGAVLPGATVLVENVNTGIRREAVTDSSGRYAFPQLQPGKYRITGRAPGFADVVIQDVELLVNSPATVNVLFEKHGNSLW